MYASLINTHNGLSLKFFFICFYVQLQGLCGNLNYQIDDERLMENGAPAPTDNIFIEAYSFLPSGHKCGAEITIRSKVPSVAAVRTRYVLSLNIAYL
jgi:hypothetical protein